MSTINWHSDESDFEKFKEEVIEQNLRDKYDKNGFIHVGNILNEYEIKIYSDIYDDFLSGKIDASDHRHDLGNVEEVSTKEKENICQIMWPTLYFANLNEGPIHRKTEFLAKYLFGDDMVEDFNFLISKEPFKDAPTFWHSDESYWIDLPDKRAMSFWVALDRTYVENGCMWFVPESHKAPLRPHRKYHPDKHIRVCEANEDEGVPVPLQPGELTGHGGRTLHYSRGNSTADRRRGFVVNYRPKSMVELERKNNFDHGKSGITKIINQ